MTTGKVVILMLLVLAGCSEANPLYTVDGDGGDADADPVGGRRLPGGPVSAAPATADALGTAPEAQPEVRPTDAQPGALPDALCAGKADGTICLRESYLQLEDRSYVLSRRECRAGACVAVSEHCALRCDNGAVRYPEIKTSPSNEFDLVCQWYSGPQEVCATTCTVRSFSGCPAALASCTTARCS